VLGGEWEAPWSIDIDVKRFNKIRRNKGVVVKHIYWEGNSLADYFVDLVVNFAGLKASLTDEITRKGAKTGDSLTSDAISLRTTKRLKLPDIYGVYRMIWELSEAFHFFVSWLRGIGPNFGLSFGS
ncbi:hypothetical protein HAX54_010980, partial [Datura stramonium]|nr:hypothetical protein [Datura stramonium]